MKWDLFVSFHLRKWQFILVDLVIPKIFSPALHQRKVNSNFSSALSYRTFSLQLILTHHLGRNLSLLSGPKQSTPIASPFSSSSLWREVVFQSLLVWFQILQDLLSFRRTSTEWWKETPSLWLAMFRNQVKIIMHVLFFKPACLGKIGVTCSIYCVSRIINCINWRHGHAGHFYWPPLKVTLCFIGLFKMH